MRLHSPLTLNNDLLLLLLPFHQWFFLQLSCEFYLIDLQLCATVIGRKFDVVHTDFTLSPKMGLVVC